MSSSPAISPSKDAPGLPPSSSSDGGDLQECPICLVSNVADGGGLGTLNSPCSHHFCVECLSEHFRTRAEMEVQPYFRCPYCQQSMLKFPGALTNEKLVQCILIAAGMLNVDSDLGGVVPGFGPSVPSPQANLLYCVCLAAIRDRRLDLLTKIVVALEGQGPILENARDEAVKSGDADVVRALCVEGGCDVPSSRWLVKASELGHAEMVRALVELGSDPCAVLTQKLRGSRSEEQGAEEDVTALYVAAREGRRDVVKTLVELVSKTKERMDQLAELGLWLEFENTGERPDGRTPLEIALRNGHAETAKELIRAGATTGARIRHVHGLIRGPGQQEESVSTKVAHALAEYSFAGMVSKNTTVRGGRSEAFSGSRSVDLLALGLYHGWPLDSIRVLLEAGADPNRADIRAVGKARGDSSSSTAYTTNIISDTTSDAPPPILIAITHWAVPITEGASVRIITAGLQSGVAREFNPSTGCWEVDLALYEDDCVYVRDAVAVHPDDLCVISAVGGGGE